VPKRPYYRLASSHTAELAFSPNNSPTPSRAAKARTFGAKPEKIVWGQGLRLCDCEGLRTVAEES
jgi:hypothetical protein